MADGNRAAHGVHGNGRVANLFRCHGNLARRLPPEQVKRARALRELRGRPFREVPGVVRGGGQDL